VPGDYGRNVGGVRGRRDTPTLYADVWREWAREVGNAEEVRRCGGGARLHDTITAGAVSGLQAYRRDDDDAVVAVVVVVAWQTG